MFHTYVAKFRGGMKVKTTSKSVSFKVEKKHADTLTPVGIFKRLSGKHKFLLESSIPHETKGKYSYIGADPYKEIIGEGNETIVINHESGKKQRMKKHIFLYLIEDFPKFQVDLPLPFPGGAVGYIGYDAIRNYKHIDSSLEDDLHMPDAHLMVYKSLIVYEHKSETAHLIAINIDDEQEDVLDNRIKALKEMIDQQVHIPEPESSSVSFQPDIPKKEFEHKVAKAKRYIDQGIAEQIVLSQRMEANIPGDPFSFYRKLRAANPSPYMFYIDFQDYLIFGASPETLIQTDGKNVVTNPIAGTRPRGITPAEDEQLMKDLLEDRKELSEHEMLVDLSKKELSITCQENSIHVPVYMNVEKYEHVMHLVSEVHGTLKDNFTSFDALIECLPAGTVSGSPKVQAMEVINELEDKKRGFYGGGIGYISFNHDLNIALAIRSLVIKENKAYLQTGAGIVKDSVPEDEYMETMNKAKSLMKSNLN